MPGLNLARIRANTMRGEHVGKVGTTLLLVGGFVAKAGAAGSFDPMVHMMRNLFTTTYTDGDACPNEDDACVASASCLACNEAYMAAFSDCAASLTSTSTCDDLVDAMCCAVEGCAASTGDEHGGYRHHRRQRSCTVRHRHSRYA